MSGFDDEYQAEIGKITIRFLQRGGVPVPLTKSRAPPGGYWNRFQKCWLCLPGPLRGSGSSGNLHRVPNPRVWTIGFSGWLVLVLRAPPGTFLYGGA